MYTAWFLERLFLGVAGDNLEIICGKRARIFSFGGGAARGGSRQEEHRAALQVMALTLYFSANPLSATMLPLAGSHSSFLIGGFLETLGSRGFTRCFVFPSKSEAVLEFMDLHVKRKKRPPVCGGGVCGETQTKRIHKKNIKKMTIYIYIYDFFCLCLQQKVQSTSNLTVKVIDTDTVRTVHSEFSSGIEKGGGGVVNKGNLSGFMTAAEELPSRHAIVILDIHCLT